MAKIERCAWTTVTRKILVRWYGQRHGSSSTTSARSHLRVTAHSPTLWEVTFDNPPVNVIGPDMIRDLKELLTELESNATVNVVVFDSADPDFFLAHYDLGRQSRRSPRRFQPDRYAAWVDITVSISKLSAVTISAVRGIARGAGSEFALATDIRFASREKAVLGQMEVGVRRGARWAAPPDGCPRWSARRRAFEILLGR